MSTEPVSDRPELSRLRVVPDRCAVPKDSRFAASGAWPESTAVVRSSDTVITTWVPLTVVLAGVAQDQSPALADAEATEDHM
jgi:hypothetical protein